MCRRKTIIHIQSAIKVVLKKEITLLHRFCTHECAIRFSCCIQHYAANNKESFNCRRYPYCGFIPPKLHVSGYTRQHIYLYFRCEQWLSQQWHEIYVYTQTKSAPIYCLYFSDKKISIFFSISNILKLLFQEVVCFVWNNVIKSRKNTLIFYIIYYKTLLYKNVTIRSLEFIVTT